METRRNLGSMKHPWRYCMIALLVIFQSNCREQGTASDTLPLKTVGFSIAKGHGFSVGEVIAPMQARQHMGDSWDGMKPGHPWYRMDRSPYTVVPFVPFYYLYLKSGGPVTLFWVNFIAKQISVLSALVTLTLLYLIAVRLGVDRKRAALWMFAFGCATNFWNTLSQGLWTTTGFIPLFCAGLYFSLAPRLNRVTAGAASLCWGYAIACRLQDAPVILPFLLYLAWRRRHDLFPVFGPIFACSLMALASNVAQTGALAGAYLQTGASAVMQAQRSGGAVGFSATTAIKGIPGILFSPGRGLFFYSPMLAFSVIWAIAAWRARRPRYELIALCAVSIVLQTVIIGSYAYWWGGWSWGPRMLVSTLPAFVIMTMVSLPRRISGARRVILVAFISWGIFTQALGAYKYHGWMWNWQPVNVDTDPSRVWNVVDNPISRAWNEPFFFTNWSTFSLDF